MSFKTLLDKYRRLSFSERDKGDRFERLIQAYLLTDRKYSNKLKKVWLWSEFPFRKEFGGSDIGIDLVGKTHDGDYWAIQCKCYDESTNISKKHVDTFFSTAGKTFQNENHQNTSFSYCLWIDTTGKAFSDNASEIFTNRAIPAGRLSLYDLISAPVDWIGLENGISGDKGRSKGKDLRDHQILAVNKAKEHFALNDRGKLIMACGTGKTFTSLRIAENETNGKGLILFLVPSIALLGQTLNEWYGDAKDPINAICICSDPEVSKKKQKALDLDMTSVNDLAYPASTDVKNILKQFDLISHKDTKGLTVVFSTYQSIDVIVEAQKALLQRTKSKYGIFDLIICDEAHRTTGISLDGEDDSSFTKVHDNSLISAKKRLYMTATPRIYSDDAVARASQADAKLYSMDDVSLYGEEIYRIGFGEAVQKGLLSDYKVLILTLNEHNIPPAIQKFVNDKDSEVTSDDASKLIGCINALSKQILGDEGIIKETDPEPMRRAIAFCQSINVSEKISNVFNETSDTYIRELPKEKRESMQLVSSKHVDGTMPIIERKELLEWLKEDSHDKECKVLTNVRCLSEGVDVPALDAVLFLSPRNSVVDVVQSVGRVMRKDPAGNKKYGYIIIPVIIPSNVEPDIALNDNERYKVVWTVLNALRAHDDRFNAIVNKIELNKNNPEQILVGTAPVSFDLDGTAINTEKPKQNTKDISNQLTLQFEKLQNVVFAKMVQKVGDRRYWEQWAKSVGDIARKQTDRITGLIKKEGKHQKEFNEFIKELHKNINPFITEGEAIEMLSQHIITKPVFDALFEGYSFVKNNPVSYAMQKMLEALEDVSIDKDTHELDKFYESVKTRASGIDNAEGKQKIIIELYDKFFATAFPKLKEKLGIVYTPIEVVDFQLHSINDILKKEFNRSISDENIHLLDPFTGTGTYMVRLLQSGLINNKDLFRKYTKELHANEIVLLAYYIATINIENAYHDATPETDDGIGTDKYTPFEGIVLTDTFQIGEVEATEQFFSDKFSLNTKRRNRQKNTPIRIIMGNPPYSVGQRSANDNAQNQSYPKLETRIGDTYAHASRATNKNSLYDSYIKAFRWSSDKLGAEGGIICFVTNGAWLDGNSADGFRKSLEKEFTSIYVFNLRGNARTQGELRRKEAGNVFKEGSRTPISITLLVKNPEKKVNKAEIYYHDIGDYLDRDKKLTIVKDFKSFGNPTMPLQMLNTNEHGDWISMRNSIFEDYIPIVPDKKFNTGSKSIFILNSLGAGTSRDAWVINYSKTTLTTNVKETINFYNNQVNLFRRLKESKPNLRAEEFIDRAPNKISWSSSLIPDVERGTSIVFDNNRIVSVSYRPFIKQNIYFGQRLIHRPGQFEMLFSKTFDENNLLISISSNSNGLSVLITDRITDIHFNGDTQCFPLYFYIDSHEPKGLFDTQSKIQRKDGISDFILERAHQQYGNRVAKEDIFYYVYGFLHSKVYRETFANDLKMMLPRLPLVEEPKDFWAFSKAGRKLAELHLNYESIPAYPELKITGDTGKDYTVEKMRFPSKNQKDTIIYNSRITVSNIPAQAYEYVVNGKSAIEWIMERYQITTHKESGIVNNPNDWAIEQEQPRYILDLLLSIVNVSVQTVDIVNSLPKLKF